MTRRTALPALPASVLARNPQIVTPTATRPPCAFCGAPSTYIVGRINACGDHRDRAAVARRATPRATPLPLDATAGAVVVELPGLRLVSEANTRAAAHWARTKRTELARAVVGRAFRGVALPPLPLRVCLTRVGPRTLDDDNAAGACKALRDAVAAAVGVDDADPRVAWRVSQAKGAYGARVTLLPVDGRGSVEATPTADVVRLRVTRADAEACVRGLAAGRATLAAGGVVVEVTVEGEGR